MSPWVLLYSILLSRHIFLNITFYFWVASWTHTDQLNLKEVYLFIKGHVDQYLKSKLANKQMSGLMKVTLDLARLSLLVLWF